MNGALINRITWAKLAANYNGQLATNTGLAPTLDELPLSLKEGLAANLDGPLKKVPGLGKAARFAKPIPLAGTVIAGYGVATKIAGGENPAQAAASGVGGMAAGVVVGELVGGPIGIVGGAIAGSGVSWAFDNWEMT